MVNSICSLFSLHFISHHQSAKSFDSGIFRQGYGTIRGVTGILVSLQYPLSTLLNHTGFADESHAVCRLGQWVAYLPEQTGAGGPNYRIVREPNHREPNLRTCNFLR